MQLFSEVLETKGALHRTGKDILYVADRKGYKVLARQMGIFICRGQVGIYSGQWDIHKGQVGLHMYIGKSRDICRGQLGIYVCIGDS